MGWKQDYWWQSALKVKMDLFEEGRFNDIYISDLKTPIVVFIGNEACGKTIALIRMIRFLESQGYRVIPVEDFKCDYDYMYKRSCSAFRELVYSNFNPGWPRRTPMLIKVLNPNGQPICQITDLSGFLTDDSFKHEKFPAYIDTLIRSGNKKFWIFFIEHGWGDDQDRNIYSQKISELQDLISSKDKIGFLFCKCDRQRISGLYDKTGKPCKKLIFNQIKREYPDIFTRHQNSGLIKLLYGDYNFKNVFFSSGYFTQVNDGITVWTLSENWYCSVLWKVILSSIR